MDGELAVLVEPEQRGRSLDPDEPLAATVARIERAFDLVADGLAGYAVMTSGERA
jgi:hypothetical protein